MANQTVKDAISIKGTNPQYLVEKIVRTRIYDSRYWKEECFGLTAELIVDKAMELKSIGGIYGGNVKPTPFLCLILKMLQIQPEKDIIVEFIRNEDFKYMRALGAFYMRLTGSAADVYKYLEPLYIDYRKMKRMNKNAKYELVHMDEFIDELLHSERVCDVSLPRLQKRHVLEETNELEPRVSPLEVDLDEAESEEEEEDDEESETSSIADHKRSGEKSKRDDRDSKHDRRDEHHRHSKKDDRDDERRSKRETSREREKKRRGRYVDYDQPDDDDLKLYERRRERTPEQRTSSRREESSKKSRGSSRERERERRERGNRSRERERSRDRDRDRDRSRDRGERDRGDEKKSSKRRERSKERSAHH